MSFFSSTNVFFEEIPNSAKKSKLKYLISASPNSKAFLLIPKKTFNSSIMYLLS